MEAFLCDVQKTGWMSDQVHAGAEHVYSCCSLMTYHQMVYQILNGTEQGILELINHVQGLGFRSTCLPLHRIYNDVVYDTARWKEGREELDK